MEPRNRVWGLKGLKGAPESLVLQDIPLPKIDCAAPSFIN